MSRTVDPEILLGFLEEASGYLPAVRTGIAALRDNPADLAAAEEAHRGVHTIKGAAAMVGLNGLSHIAHHFEEAFDDILGGRLQLEPQIFPILERAVGHIEEYLEATLGENLDEDKLVAEAVEGLRAIRGLPAVASAATGAALGGGPGWVLPFEELEPSLDDTVDDFAGLGLPSFGDPEETIADADLLPPPAFATPSPNDVSPELLEVFKMEADDHLRALTTLLPGTKANPADRDQWSEIRRAAHTLKGTAAMVGFADVTKLAHRMEDLLDLYFEGTRVAKSEEIDLLLNGTDAIEDTINGRPAAFAPLYAKLDAALASNAPVVAPEASMPEPIALPPEIADDEPAEKAEAKANRRETAEAYVRVPIERLNDIVKLVGELVISRTAFEARMGDFQKLLNELDPSTTRLRRASGKLDTGFEALALGGESTAAPADGFDSLELDRYTEFHLVSRELAETTNDIQTLAGELGHVHGDCDGFLTRQARLASELEDKLMRLRMVPLSTTANKLQRTVRNAAEQTRKKAQLVLEGERTGLDKTVLEAMADPLLHLLRNAVDHGLETPEVRRALGKPEAGTIRLSAIHEGNQVVLRIADDGRGIDANAVRETAIARGIDAHDLALEDVYGLLFAPGFSTKGEVSELSGRGVGLDVVKSKVEALKGTVSIASKIGKGTTFTIRLPLTLAVTRALLVQSNGQTFAIPLDCVEQILRFEESDVQRIGREPVLQIGESTYPVAHLGRVLELKTPSDDAVKRPPVLLVRAGEKRLALVVEHLIGGREIVIKNLGPHLRKTPTVTGATLLGDGSVVLILNPPELVRASAARAAMEMSMLMPRSVPQRARTATTVLLVDDSPSVRRVLTTLAERQGWKPIAAKDGIEALEILQRGQALPDIVLSDVEMPRMDGFELLGSIRGQANLARLPVVMITSRAAEKHRRKAMDLGASAYVTKPYQDESLVDVIRHLTRSTK